MGQAELSGELSGRVSGAGLAGWWLGGGAGLKWGCGTVGQIVARQLG